jgi:hypothetical protein
MDIKCDHVKECVCYQNMCDFCLRNSLARAIRFYTYDYYDDCSSYAIKEDEG